jgi:hypothetical protein
MPDEVILVRELITPASLQHENQGHPLIPLYDQRCRTHLFHGHPPPMRFIVSSVPSCWPISALPRHF